MGEFDNLRKEMNDFDTAREAIIKESRGVLKASKQAIYAIHRGDIAEAEKLVKQATDEKQVIEKQITNPKLRTGGFSGACEELAEAMTFLHYHKTGELLAYDGLGITSEEYLGGLADLTGELGRRAVILATDRKTEEVKKIKEFTEMIYGEFVTFDFRNGELRRKYDSIKYNLQKMERLLYDLEMNK
jgi:predicted translin family RNA/ssDNA-binding protein